MTYEAEMKEYLQAKKLPSNESTYPEELMTQITIDAIEELFEQLDQQQEEHDRGFEDGKLEYYVLENKFYDMKHDWEVCRHTLRKQKEKFEKLLKLYESLLIAFNKTIKRLDTA